MKDFSIIYKSIDENSHQFYKDGLSSFKTEYKVWLTSEEAASYLKISISRLMNLSSNGKIPYYKFGRSNRYLLSELEAVLMSQPKGERHGN